MLRDVISRLEERYPGLARWVGDRADLQVPAWGVSFLFHLMLIGSLGMVGYAAHTATKPPVFRTEMVDTALSDFATLDSTAIAEIDKPTQMAPVAGSFGPTTSAMIVANPVPNAAPPKVSPALSTPGIAKVASVDLPTPTHLDKNLQVQGSGSEHVGSVEGAVDRIAVEILRKMEGGRTLVVWAFDASGSLVAERERLNKYIDGVYTHVLQMDKEHLTEDGGLLTAVVAFGKDRKVIAEPTADRQEVISAIAAVPLDTTGVESTFQTVGEIARRFGHYKKDKLAYRTMVVVVTDEVGDDEDALESAIGAANAVKVPVYVLGSPALFGKVEGHMDYIDPKTKQQYRNLPVRQGPETVALEGIRLPFWYDGPQYDVLDAGFGPYALSRLAGATGGIYFVTRMGNNRVSFDPAGMREYKPDWVSREQYIRAVNNHPIRLAVMRASLITQQKLPGQPGLNFPAADSPEFKEAMARNQEVVAQIQYTVDEALGSSNAASNEPTILNTAKKRDHETARRWQAHYDLIRGRLLAMKTRCLEYNTACAKMKKDAPKFTKPTSNAWQLVPDPEVHLKGKDLADAEEAAMLLDNVLKNHPGTPWALLAKRERKDPFGFRWVEVTVPPPPKRNENAEAKKKKAEPKKEMPKPAELPKL